jgi:phage repressor protein C with HTH and peptisase S24 domain
MSDNSNLGEALRSKQETRATEGAAEAQQAAAGSIDWEEVGQHAMKKDQEDRPRRKQTNIGLPEDLKRRFKSKLNEEGLQMRFVVEDLIRVYLDAHRG